MDHQIQDQNFPLEQVETARFCSKCGADLKGAILLCPQCGKQISHPSFNPDTVPRQKMSSKTKHRLIRAGISVLILTVLLLIFVFNGRALTPQAAVDNYVAILNGDLDKIRFTKPLDSWLTAADKQYDSVDNILSSAKEEVQKTIDTLYATYGPYSVSGKITSEEDLKDYEVEALHKSIDGWVTAGKRLTILLTITTLNGSGTTSLRATAVRIGLHWYLFI